MSDGKRIGLLGGSFNPAHDGHLHISRAAFERLKIDEVWWMVSPQNPLKKAHDMSDFNSRIQSAEDIADDPRIIVSDIEQEMGTVFTVDTLEALKKKFPSELRGLKFATTEFDAGKKGTFIRLMGTPFKTKASANNFCKKLKAKRQYCKGERARP